MSLDKIEHVVHLMLENRSFDSMLGWLYEADRPQHNIPAAAKGDEFRGLYGVNLMEFVNHADALDVSSKPIRGTIGASVPDSHPGEELSHVTTQLFNQPQAGAPSSANMQGYMNDYALMLKKAKNDDATAKEMVDMVMQSFTPQQLPVLNQLAKHYAVCDDWYSSVPSQTNTNRAFALIGNSHGLVDNGFLEKNPIAKQLGEVLGMGIGDDRFPGKTIFNVLDENGHKEWKVFWETSMIPEKISNLLHKSGDALSYLKTLANTIPALHKTVEFIDKIAKDLAPYANYIDEISSGDLSSVYSYRLYEELHNKVDDLDNHFDRIEEFHKLARAGKLPKFSYIEPRWTIASTTVDRGFERLVTTMGNDYHPPGNLNEAENYLKGIYESLTANKAAWEKTLFIITFDEPVGSFDHVTPPAAKPPWGDATPEFELEQGFKFDRYGGRVPAILVSPLIEKGTVFRSEKPMPFDHASVITTVLDWCQLGDKASEFGVRAQHAPTFSHVLTRQTPRTDAGDIGFMNLQRSLGEPVLYGDRFRLKNQNGEYLTEFVKAPIIGFDVIPDDLESIAFDLGLKQNFPTLSGGQPANLFFQSASVADPTQVNSGDVLRIASDELALESFNYLGAWKDSHDCYYYNLYLRGEHADKQRWRLEKLDATGAGLKFGDKVYLVNQSFADQRLSQDDRLLQGKWITTKKGGDFWTIEPVS